MKVKGKNATLEKGKYKEKHGFLLHFLNEYFILPWVPSTIEIFASIYFFLWFCLTITIGIARYYEKKWTQEVFFQQGPFNYLVHALFNCSTVDMTLIDYTEEINHSSNQNPARQSPEELDPYFTKHLTFGILWLSVGFYHILNARHGWSSNPEINRAVHRWFGRLVAMPSYLLHYYYAWKMVLRNPVEQDPIIKFQYIGTLGMFFRLLSFFEPIIILKHIFSVDNAILCFLGLNLIFLARKEKDPKKKKELHGKHKTRMVFMYIESMFGSGTIRVTAWILWMIAKFCPRYIAMNLDRGVCQQSAACRGQFLGSAESCWISTYINLSLGILLNLLLEYLFVKIPGNDFDKHEYRIIKHRVNSVFKALLVIIPFILWKGHEDSLFGKIIYYGGFLLSMKSRMVVSSIVSKLLYFQLLLTDMATSFNFE